MREDVERFLTDKLFLRVTPTMVTYAKDLIECDHVDLSIIMPFARTLDRECRVIGATVISDFNSLLTGVEQKTLTPGETYDKFVELSPLTSSNTVVARVLEYRRETEDDQ